MLSNILRLSSEVCLSDLNFLKKKVEKKMRMGSKMGSEKKYSSPSRPSAASSPSRPSAASSLSRPSGGNSYSYFTLIDFPTLIAPLQIALESSLKKKNHGQALRGQAFKGPNGHSQTPKVAHGCRSSEPLQVGPSKRRAAKAAD